MMGLIQFDTYLNVTEVPSNVTLDLLFEKGVPIFLPTLANVTDLPVVQGRESLIDEVNRYDSPVTTKRSKSFLLPILFTVASSVASLAVLYGMSQSKETYETEERSTPLPGYGILGDKVNEVIELFLDALAVYVHNDSKWQCQRRMLCEANQRAGEYGVVHAVLMYFLSLGVSFLLQNQKVSESLEAMKIGRRGGDCAQRFSSCPFSLR